MPQETLIIEDLMRLMLDDKSGVTAGANTTHYPLDGALLIGLASRERVALDEGQARWGTAQISVIGNLGRADP